MLGLMRNNVRRIVRVFRVSNFLAPCCEIRFNLSEIVGVTESKQTYVSQGSVLADTVARLAPFDRDYYYFESIIKYHCFFFR